MPAKDDSLQRRLLATFKPEAQEHIQAIASGLLQLEKTVAADARAGILDATFRAAHSLKGAARTVNIRDIETICQALESVFAALKRKQIEWSAELFDLLHKVADVLDKLLSAMDTQPSAAQQAGIVDLLRLLQAAAENKTFGKVQDKTQVRSFEKTQDSQSKPVFAESKPEPVSSSTLSTAKGPTASASESPHETEKRPAFDASLDTIRVATTKLDAVLLQSEELLAAKLAAAQHTVRVRQCQSQPAEWKKRWAKLQPDLRSLRQTFDRKENGIARSSSQGARVMDFLEWTRDLIESLDGKLSDLAKAADHDQRSIAAMVDTLLDDMKKVVMQPFSTLLDVLPRFVRELSREQGKAVQLTIRGEDIEIDRRILEEIKDPLIHLVRNCLDHGIELPQIRVQKGKPPQGTLTIGIAARDGSNVELLIADDGAGINAATVRACAQKMEFLAPEQLAALDDKEVLSLIFQSGISTSPIITDISGRGLGLAIVKEKVEKLNGSLSVQTEPDQGTKFSIVLPLTLARFRGVLVRMDEHCFVLPTVNVERVLRVARGDIKTVENRATIVFNGQVIPLARLGEILQLPHANGSNVEPTHQPVVILAAGEQRIAFAIDEVVAEQEVLVKTLGKQLARVQNIAGATVLGSGRVVPILSVPDLMKSALRSGQASHRSSVISVPGMAAAAAAKKSVLIAEDSITSRILLKNILETAGYQVETAVDGMEGYSKLRSGTFDLVVSDVEMPRMDGFGLTAKVRADKKLTELPVVLVTALDSREDRERGIDVGANAYIVKSSFDQSNLLEVVRRLI